jgi:hypothetical protein
VTTQSIKGILASFPHHLDHLAPISFYEKIPLLVRNNETEEALVDFYPWVPYFRLGDFPKIGELDTFISTSTSETPLRELHHALYGIKPKMVRFHHGFSDKFQDFSLYDSVLSYKDFPNHRLRFHYEFRNEILKRAKKFLPVSENLKPLLIALTWDSPHIEEKLNELCHHPFRERFVFRFHPILAERELVHHKLQAKHDIHILSHTCPYIYPFLEAHSGVLTDRSSIGYDALYFRKPLFVLDDVPLKKFSSKSIHEWILESDTDGEKPNFQKEYTKIFGPYPN